MTTTKSAAYTPGPSHFAAMARFHANAAAFYAAEASKSRGAKRERMERDAKGAAALSSECAALARAEGRT